jgi:hypothetical protein
MLALDDSEDVMEEETRGNRRETRRPRRGSSLKLKLQI